MLKATKIYKRLLKQNHQKKKNFNIIQYIFIKRIL